MNDLVGFAAAACVLLAYVPQIWKSWRTRKTDDLSLSTAIMLICASILWIIYGTFIGSYPIIIVNIGVLISIGLILTAALIPK